MRTGEFTKKSLILIIVISGVCFAIAYFLLFTTPGGSLAVKLAVLHISKAERVEFRNAGGSIINKFTAKDVRITGLKGLRQDSAAAIKRLDIRLTWFSRNGLHLSVSEGSLILPDSDIINFSGTLERGVMDFLIQSGSVDLAQMLRLFPEVKIGQNISGRLSNIEISISGPVDEAAIDGGFSLQDVSEERFVIYEGVCSVKCAAKIFDKKPRVKGFITLENMRTGLKGFLNSEGTVQKAGIEFDSGDINGVIIKVLNGRLSLQNSGLVFFNGIYSAGIFDFNVYSKRIGIGGLAPLSQVKGDLSDIDFFLKGSVREFGLKGTGTGERLEHKSFSLTDAPFACDLTFMNAPENARASGAVIIKKGRISGPRTAVIELDESRLSFSGDITKPDLNVKGRSTVEGTRIRISLKGTQEKPDLVLSSEPPLPQEQLLVMLATGKKWTGIGTVFGKGEISADLAIDFFDYFVLGGAGSKIAGKFGITGFSVTFDETKQGVEVKKSVTDKAEIGYGVMQTHSKENPPEITQKVSGELKVTDSISVSAEKELKQAPAAGGPASDQVANDTVMIKFKKSF